MPMPMIPHVPTSMRLRGWYMSTMLCVIRARSRLVDQDRVGIRLTASRTTLSAL
jgi:hypothetical protein